MKPRAYYEAIATLTGCAIGAGILGIPYVVVKAGFWTGLLVIGAIGIAVVVLHLMIGELSLRSKISHQLVGHASKYLGKKGKYVMTFSMLVGVYGSLIAYILGVSESLQSIFGGPQWWWGLLFYGCMGIIIYGGLRRLERSELWMESVKYVIFAAILIFLFSSFQFSSTRLSGFSFDNILIPYGVILFATMGTAAIPEVREGLRTHSHLIKRAIIVGTAITIMFYALFAIAVVGVTGQATTEVATIGIANLLGGSAFVLLHLFAILAMATSFAALGYALKQVYQLDFHISNFKSWVLTLLVPLLILTLGVDSFVRTLQLTGTFAGGTAGIMIILMHMKAKKKSGRKPEFTFRINWLGYGALITLFLIGMVYEIIKLVLS